MAKKKKATESKKTNKSSESLFPKSPYLYAGEQKSFKKYGRKKDESADDFLDRIMGNTKKEREKNFYNTMKKLGMLDDVVKAKQLDDEARRRQRQLGTKKTKKQLSRQEEIRRGIPNRRMMRRQFEEEADEFKSIPPSRKKADSPLYHFKHKRRKENQMDRDDPEGINVEKGGLILRVTNRGPLYKGKKSGNKNS